MRNVVRNSASSRSYGLVKLAADPNLRVWAPSVRCGASPGAAVRPGADSIADTGPRCWALGGYRDRLRRGGRGALVIRDPVGAHNSVVGVDQGFRAPSGDQESVRDSVHEDSASAPSAAVGAHNSVVGADQGFRAPSGDQESVRDSVHEDSASAPIAAGQRPRQSFRHPQGSLPTLGRPAHVPCGVTDRIARILTACADGRRPGRRLPRPQRPPPGVPKC